MAPVRACPALLRGEVTRRNEDEERVYDLVGAARYRTAAMVTNGP